MFSFRVYSNGYACLPSVFVMSQEASDLKEEKNMIMVGILLGFITSVGIVYVSIIQRQIMEDQRKQIDVQNQLLGKLHEVLTQGDGS